MSSAAGISSAVVAAVDAAAVAAAVAVESMLLTRPAHLAPSSSDVIYMQTQSPTQVRRPQRQRHNQKESVHQRSANTIAQKTPSPTHQQRGPELKPQSQQAS
jgi:hypothetical protein